MKPAWAYSFPLAAMTITSFAIAKRSGLDGFHWIAAVLLAIVNALWLEAQDEK